LLYLVAVTRARWTFALAAALVAGSADASPEDLFGYGPRSTALGGTGAATARGFEAAFGNPALLSLERERRLTLGYLGATFDAHADGAGLPGRIEQAPARGVVIGVDVPLPLGGILRDRIGFALAFYTPTDVIVRGRILYPETPQFPLMGDRAQSLAVRMGLGADVGHGFRVGVGFAALAQIAGEVIVATDATGKVGSRVEDQLVATYSPIAGVAYERKLVRDFMRIGATFRGEQDARFAVAIDATKLSSLSIPIFNIAGLAQFDPMQVAAEGAWTRDALTVAIGVTYKHWSAYPGLVEPTILCPASDPDCGALQPTRLSFSDTFVPRVGVERSVGLGAAATLALRAGYFFEPTPVPATLAASHAFDAISHATQSVPTRFFDASRHALTAGLGVTLARPLSLRLDWSSQLHVLQARDVTIEGGPAGTSSAASLHGVVWMTSLGAGIGF
jgi:long-chain fatty acid transport protein